MKLLAGAAILLLSATLVSCSKGLYEDADATYERDKGDYSEAMPGDGGAEGDYGDYGFTEPGGEGNHQGGEAGVLTAGEWRDLDHWDFWIQKILGSQSFGSELTQWQFNTRGRIAVRVKDASGEPVANVPVILRLGSKDLWEARTSNAGVANLWLNLYGGEDTAEEVFLVVGGSELKNAKVLVSAAKEEEEPVLWNEVTYTPAKAAAKKADIAFIVDATGSMGDEIDFLKKDLLSILTSVAQSQSGVEIRTGAVFYRDEGDEYVTRSHDFTTNTSKTMEFVGKQQANGGGDLPEAVHTALEVSLKDLSWNLEARSRIAFLVLDAPAHGDRQKVIDSLQKSIRSFAQAGIRIIPVVASTSDKATEFMSRNFAIVTGGTYVFLTNDSGVGGEHLEATVGEYQVEKLNDLLVRLINEFI